MVETPSVQIWQELPPAQASPSGLQARHDPLSGVIRIQGANADRHNEIFAYCMAAL